MLARITVCVGALLTVASFDVSACNSAIFVNAPEHVTSSIVLEPPSGPEVQFDAGGFKIRSRNLSIDTVSGSSS